MPEPRRKRGTARARLVAAFAMLSMLPMLGMPLGARAQDCPEPPLRGPITVTPSDSATSVTRDAPIFLDYSLGYFGPDGPGDDPRTLITVEECGACSAFCAPGTGLPVAGRVEVYADRLYFIPDTILREGTRYLGLARGAETSLAFGFCTGRSNDVVPPTLEGVLRSSSTRVGEQCGLPSGGYRLAVTFEPATDDGPPGSIEYLLYLSRGDGIDAPIVVSRARNYAAAEITLGVLLTPEEVRTPICLTLAALDGVGNVAVSDTPQCFDPITRTVFSGEPCAASPWRARTGSGLGLWAAVAALGLARWARRKARR